MLKAQLFETLEVRRLFAAKLTTIAGFDGRYGNPVGELMIDARGNLFGTTTGGDPTVSGNYGPSHGSVYQVVAGTNKITTIATFNGSNGSRPRGSLVQDSAGNIYGTTDVGGASDCGTVFVIPTGTHAIKTLASFSNETGKTPNPGLVIDTSGNIYGTTLYGPGDNRYGSIFKVDARTRKIITLHEFNYYDGYNPRAGLIADKKGNLYGTTSAGNYWGNLFKYSTTTNTFSTLYYFDIERSGWDPVARLTIDDNDMLYGTTSAGGGVGDGTVFKISSISNEYSTIVAFRHEGSFPETPVLIDAAGNLYGSTLFNGQSYSTLFRIAVGTNTPSRLMTFTDYEAHGHAPSGLVADMEGNLYGTTEQYGPLDYGTIFKVTGAGFATFTPSAKVTGNNSTIANGDVSPSSNDGTQFGNTSVGGSIVRTFTIKNYGGVALKISNLTLPPGFSIDPSDPLATNIQAGKFDTFKVKLDATFAGRYAGQVRLSTNDIQHNNSTYTFVVEGVVNSPLFSYSNRTVTVTGTNNEDVIHGRITNGVLLLKVNSKVASYSDAGSITKLIFNGLSGNDEIALAASVNIPTSIYAGDGNDTIVGGSGVNTINGGAGHDKSTKRTRDTLTLVEEIFG